jgi:hypothetical protein
LLIDPEIPPKNELLELGNNAGVGRGVHIIDIPAARRAVGIRPNVSAQSRPGGEIPGLGFPQIIRELIHLAKRFVALKRSALRLPAVDDLLVEIRIRTEWHLDNS